MDTYRHLTPQVLAQRQKLLCNSQVIVMDTNIPAASIAWLVEHAGVPVIGYGTKSCPPSTPAGAVSRWTTRSTPPQN